MTRPGRKMGYKTELMSESAELVRTLMRNINDRKPLTTTLDKYVKVVRSEHYFLLFEELGRTDKWLQCLELMLLRRLGSYGSDLEGCANKGVQMDAETKVIYSRYRSLLKVNICNGKERSNPDGDVAFL
ncbi:hypothetical protein AgCh_035990 [Apium graveolens]